MTTPLADKVALVTGGGRGIGRAISERLARDGALVAVNYLANATAADEAVDAITSVGGAAFAIQGDVTSVPGITDLFDRLDRELAGRRDGNGLDILVNIAGTGRMGSPSDTSEDSFDTVFTGNVKAAFFVTQSAIPRLRDGGRITTISSGRSKRHLVATAAYCMAKAAIDAHTVMLAAELGPRRITVNTLAPGWTVTDLSADFLGDAENKREISAITALGRLGQPDDIADVAGLLATNDARWITGQYIEASGGFDLVATR